MLSNLIEYAKREGIEAEAGFRSKMIRWLVQLSEEGDFLGVLDLTPEGSKRRGRSFGRTPHLRFSGDTPMRQFLVDTLKFALLFGEEKPDTKLLAKHDFFLQLLQDASECDPAFGIVAKALANQDVRESICEALAEPDRKAKPVDNVTFAVMESKTPRILVKEECWHDWWRNHFPTLLNRRSDDAPMRCLVTGVLDEVADTHPKIKGLGGVGGLIDTTLISFNKDAFCSYGLEQSRNAAISKDAAQQYVAALNLAIDRGATMAGTKIAFWYVGEEIADEENLFLELMHGIDFGDAEIEEPDADDKPLSKRQIAQRTSKASELLKAIRTGKRSDLANARFNAVTLSGNSARVVIRDWMEGQFEQLAENIDAWFSDLSIIRREGRDVVCSHKFAAVLAGTVRDLKDVAAPLVSALWHAAIYNEPIPYGAMVQTLARVKIDVINDEAERHARLGLLKAFCIRKGIDMKPELNEQLNHPAYLCGRIMALLAQIQYRALGDVGAGVVQRYYSAASATPALVLGRLVRMAQVGHLPKIDGGLRVWYDKQLGEVWNLFEQAPPATLSLEDQTLFAMGFYQQKAKRYENKTADETETNE